MERRRKNKGRLMLYGGLIAFIAYMFMFSSAENNLLNEHFNYWDLADKSSKIDHKYKYINQMVESFEDSKLSGTHDAIFFKNPSNSFDKNYEALISLRDRLSEIQEMDVSSFEYQTAMSQITAQEQGEASQMIGMLQGCWFKEHHIFFWNWVATLTILSMITIIIWGAILRFIDPDDLL